jgi:OCT family organic cation transporter-like MFS transporter 4/5
MSDDATTTTRVDLDRLLEDIGAFGRYQKFIYLLICITAVFPAAATLHTVFTAAVPDYRCFVPDCDGADTTYESAFGMNGFANFTLPYLGDGKYDGCHRYGEYPYATAPSVNLTYSTCRPEHFDQRFETGCHGKYLSDESVYPSTMVTEFKLFCNSAYKVPMVESLFFVGTLLGAVVFGAAADWIGRKKTILVNDK